MKIIHMPSRRRRRTDIDQLFELVHHGFGLGLPAARHRLAIEILTRLPVRRLNVFYNINTARAKGLVKQDLVGCHLLFIMMPPVVDNNVKVTPVGPLQKITFQKSPIALVALNRGDRCRPRCIGIGGDDFEPVECRARKVGLPQQAPLPRGQPDFQHAKVFSAVGFQVVRIDAIVVGMGVAPKLAWLVETCELRQGERRLRLVTSR